MQRILSGLRDDYGNLIEKVEDKIDESTVFGIKDLKEKLAAKETRVNIWGKQERSETHEHALYGTDAAPSYYTDGFANCRDNGGGSMNRGGKNGPPRFKGKFYNCDKMEH
jgi:hypothetical protein